MRLAVLGPVELRDDAGRVVAVPGRKARQLLTVLALAAPEHRSVERLVDALWDEPPPAATKTVQAHLSRLRSALAEAGGAGALAGTRDGHALLLPSGLDVAEVAQLRLAAEQALARGDPAAAAELLGRARAAWRGEPELPDSTTGSLEAGRLHERRVALAEAHVDALLRAGHASGAAAELDVLVAGEPLRERLWELRMVALYRAGRQAEALRAYQQARDVLAEQVGVEPGPALRALEAAIVRHDVPDGLGAVPLHAAPPTPTRRAAPVPELPATDVAYARVGQVHVAWRAFGRGPVDVLLLNPGFVPIDALLDEPHLAGGIAALAEGRRVLVFDRRGTGLSDRVAPEEVRLADWVDDAGAVLAAAGSAHPHVFANADAALVALALAHRHPGRAASLVLVNAYARFTAADGYPHGFDAASFAALQPSIQSTEPGARVDVLTLISPSVAGDQAYRAWWDRVGRQAASPHAAAVLVAMVLQVDLRALLPEVATPTLLLVRRGCPSYDPGHGAHLAAHLPQATVVALQDVNDPWWVGDTRSLVAELDRWLAAR